MAEKEQLKTTEKERIEEFMREYHKLFDDGIRAVCFSSKGEFFYYELNKDFRGAYENDRYLAFVKFNTLDELKSIIKTLLVSCPRDQVLLVGILRRQTICNQMTAIV